MSRWRKCGKCAQLATGLGGWIGTEKCVDQLTDSEPSRSKGRVLSQMGQFFVPENVLRIAGHFEIHNTPKQCNRHNMAELETDVLCSHCPDRRIPNRQTPFREVAAWQRNRNGSRKPVDWRFRTEDAHIRLNSPYPLLQ